MLQKIQLVTVAFQYKTIVIFFQNADYILNIGSQCLTIYKF